MKNPSTSIEPDWRQWRAAERAVLCFIIKDGRVLLIHKKTGLGAGKINGPGGRIEAGETPAEAAVRECLEETGLRPIGLAEAGVLRFQFTDGYALHGTVFRAEDALGEPVSTAEADPFWCQLDQVPFDRMWQDDRLWFPDLLGRRYFSGYFVFDEDRLAAGRLE